MTLPDDFEPVDERDDVLVEMTYAWPDIETSIPAWSPVAEALKKAFRVEAIEDHNKFGDPQTIYALLFDAEDESSRAAARIIRDSPGELENAIHQCVKVWDTRFTHRVRVVPRSISAHGLLCARDGEPLPKKHLDVSEIPERKPTGNVPYIEKDGYWLTPIEVPFYDALRETGAIFAVQPWIQGVEQKYRPDFMVFYDGGVMIVELDGHETHKTREQRTYDARRQRWFAERGIQMVRWTGSEIHANAQDCVRQLLEILRGSKSRF